MGRFLNQSIITYKALYGYLDLKTYLLFKVLTPIFQLIFFSLIANYIYQADDITPWILGNALILSMYNSIFGVGTIMTSERAFGTLKSLVASPTNNFTIFTSRAFFHIFDSLFTVTIGLVIGSIIFNTDFSQTNFLYLFICVFLCMFSSVGMGLLLSSIGLIITDINLVLNIMVFVLLIFTGAIFPISNLPTFLQYITEFIPITSGLKAGREIVAGAGLLEVNFLLLKELFIGAVYIALGYLAFIRLEKISRIKGTIDIY